MINKCQQIVLCFFIVLFGIGCMPDGVQPLRNDPNAVLAYEYVKEAWRNDPHLSHRNLNDNVCDLDNLFIVDMNDSEFKEWAGSPSCYLASNPDQEGCAIAQWSVVRPRNTVIVFSEHIPAERRIRTYYHELIHFFTWCTRESRDADSNHSNHHAWEEGVMGNAIKNCQDDYANVSSLERNDMIKNNVGVCPLP